MPGLKMHKQACNMHGHKNKNLINSDKILALIMLFVYYGNNGYLYHRLMIY